MLAWAAGLVTVFYGSKLIGVDFLVDYARLIALILALPAGWLFFTYKDHKEDRRLRRGRRSRDQQDDTR
jgi:hypothetical protein